jgi:O-antigen/teichoic acid export membrane protein
MRKSFKNISFVSAGNILNTILGFIFLTALARTLPLEDFGKYALLTSLLTFLAKGTDFGTNSLYISKTITTSDKNLTSVFYSLKTLLLILMIPVSVGILKILNINDIYMILLFIAGLIAYCVNFTIYTLFQKNEDYLMLIIVNGIIAVIKAIFAALILLNIFKPNLFSAFGIFSLSIYPSLFLIYFLPKEFKQFKLSFTKTKRYITEAFPAGISLLVSEGWSFVANIITKYAKDFSNVGIYSLADKLSNIFSLISFSIFTVLLPKNSIRKKENIGYDVKETILISIGIFALAFMGMIASNILVVPIFGNNFQNSLPIIYILFMASAFMAINGFMENYFFVENKTKTLLPIALFRITTFIVSSIILIPNYEVNGIALASLLSSSLVTIIVFSILLIDKNKQKHELN